MEVYVVRHTRVAVDKGLCYGQSEMPLAATFGEEYAALKGQLPAQIDAVFSSSSQRCLQLAAQFSDNVQIEDALLEMDFGDWEGQKWNDIPAEALNDWMNDFVHVKAPNGENLVSLSARVSAFLESLRQQNHDQCLIVTHAGAIRCIWAYLLEIPLKNCFKITVDFGEILHFNLAKDANFDTIKRPR